jgi:hypothetical protein
MSLLQVCNETITTQLQRERLAETPPSLFCRRTNREREEGVTTTVRTNREREEGVTTTVRTL